MLMTSAPTITAVIIAALMASLAIAFFVWDATQDPHGDESSLSQSPEGTWSPRKPSIVRSATNSTASITVPANPARPLVYSVEPVSGSSRLVKLTVLYEQSLDDLESAILKSADLDLKPSEPITGVDDPQWIAKIEQMRSGPRSSGH